MLRKSSAHFSPLLNVAIVYKTSSRIVQLIYPAFADLLTLSLLPHHP